MEHDGTEWKMMINVDNPLSTHSLEHVEKMCRAGRAAALKQAASTSGRVSPTKVAVLVIGIKPQFLGLKIQKNPLKPPTK